MTSKIVNSLGWYRLRSFYPQDRNRGAVRQTQEKAITCATSVCYREVQTNVTTWMGSFRIVFVPVTNRLFLSLSNCTDREDFNPQIHLERKKNKDGFGKGVASICSETNHLTVLDGKLSPLRLRLHIVLHPCKWFIPPLQGFQMPTRVHHP